jgi:hypothetical protein
VTLRSNLRAQNNPDACSWGTLPGRPMMRSILSSMLWAQRTTTWDGRLNVEASRILRTGVINNWNLDRGIQQADASQVSWKAVTTGNHGGIDVWMDGTAGRLAFQTKPVSEDAPRRFVASHSSFGLLALQPGLRCGAPPRTLSGAIRCHHERHARWPPSRRARTGRTAARARLKTDANSTSYARPTAGEPPV